MALGRLFTVVLLLSFLTAGVQAGVVPGKTAGQVSVSLTGSSQYTVPFAVPKGTAGMEPKLFLSYDSNSGPGQFGLGWSLTGLTQISRVNRTRLIDGFSGAVDFDDDIDGYSTDAIALDGARLVPAPEGGKFLSKSIDDQTRVWRDGQKFVAKTKAGLTIYFGETPNSRIKTKGGETFVWAVSRIIDTFGNQIFFFYRNTAGDWGPSSIYWTVHSGKLSASTIHSENTVANTAFAKTVFEWEAAAADFVTTSFMGGEETKKSHYIKSISSYVSDKQFRRYEFTYDQIQRFGQRRLKSIRELGAEVASGQDEYGKTEFTYTDFMPQWNEEKDYNLPENFGDFDSVRSGFHFLDFDDDEQKDLLYSAHVNGQAIRRSFLKQSVGWKTDGKVLPAPPIETDFSAASTKQNPIIFSDLNGDGKKEILFSKKDAEGEKRLTYTVNNDKWQIIESLAPPFLIVDDKERQTHAITLTEAGNNKILAWNISGQVSLYSSDGTDWTTEQIGDVPAPSSDFDPVVGKFRCSSSEEQIVAVSKDKLSITLFEIVTDSDGIKTLTSAAVQVFASEIAELVKIKDSNCAKIGVKTVGSSMPFVSVFAVDDDGWTKENIDFENNQIGSIENVFTADITGTGQDAIGLILPAKLNETNIVFFATDGNGNWTRDAQFDYVPQDSSFLVDSAYRLEPVKIDANDNEDLLLLPAAKGVVARALINNGSGFDPNSNLIPDIEFAIEEKVGASPQFVDINSDGLVDLLGYHIDHEGKTVIRTTQINVKNGWVTPTASDLLLPQPVSSDKGGIVGKFLDFNSDGIADFVHAGEDKAKWGAWSVKFDEDGVPLKWETISGFKLPNEAKLSHKDFGDMGVRFFDVNGDGRVDVVVSRREKNGDFYRFVALNTGSGWSADQPKYHPPVPFVSQHRADVHFESDNNQADYYRDLSIKTNDLNGDGLTDLILWYGFKKDVNANDPYDPLRDGCQNNPIPILDANGQPVLDAAGQPTFEPHPIDTEKYCAAVYYLTKNGWVQGPDSHLPPIQFDMSVEKENATIDLVDINGDGLIDIIPARKVGNANEFPEAFLNSGKSWQNRSEYGIPAGALSTNEKLSAHRLIDLNGDGLLDIVYSRPNEAERGAYFNSGSRFRQANSSFKPKRPFFNDKGEDLGIRFVDVDGNGMPDMLESFRKKDGAFSRSAFLNNGSVDANGFNSPEDRADMLKTVTNSMGLVTTLSYRSLLTPRGTIQIGSNDFYTPSPISPVVNERGHVIISHVPTMYAVEKFSYIDTDQSEIGTKYQYKGFRLDLDASTPLGFESRIAKSFIKPVNLAAYETDVVEKVKLYQDYFFNGRSKHEEAIVNGIVTAKTFTNYKLFEMSPDSWPKRIVITDSSTVTRDISTVRDALGDETGATKQYYEYDEHNNATKVCVEYGDGSRTLTDNSYDNSQDLLDPNIWFLGRLTKAEVTHFRSENPLACTSLLEGFSGVPPDEYLTNTAKFEYDLQRDGDGKFAPESTGVVKSETSNPDHPLWVKKSYSHDQFGNITNEVSQANDALERSRDTTYTDDGRFAVSEANSLGHTVQYEYNKLLGLPNTAIDPNGIITTSQHDGFGRVVEAISSTGVKSSELREFDVSVEIAGRKSSFYIKKQNGSLADIITYFDKQGRVLRVDQEGYNACRIYQDTEYDQRGRAIGASLPYFADPSCDSIKNRKIYWTKTSYDNLDRVIAILAADGGVRTSTYAGLETIYEDDAGKRYRKIVSEKGLTLKTVDNAGGEITFIYGPGDRLHKSVQVDGSKLIYQYDQLGNKTKSVDPDLGEWNYQYNGFGEVILQRDAKGQITTIDYDSLGRPTKRHMPDKIDEFKYDTAKFGIGKPAKVTNSEGFEEIFTYDKRSRIKRKSTKVHNEIYSTFVTYDEYNRVVQASHPGNYIVTNEFDEQGHLKRVLANNPLKPILAHPTVHWEALQRDQFGRVIEEQMGNGLVTTQEFDPQKGNLASTKTGDAAGVKNIAHYIFDYDLVGNLRSKDDQIGGRYEAYFYEDEIENNPNRLDRLTTWKVNGLVEGEYEYDAAGRIVSKSGIGTYQYSNLGLAHGVKEIISPDGTTSEYNYDANGNMVSGPKGHFGYYSNNSVKHIYASNERWSRFEYAPDGSGIFQHYSEMREIEKGISVVDVRQTISVGSYEKVSDLGGAFIIKPGGSQRHRLYLTADTGVVAVLEHSTQFDPLHHEPWFKEKQEGSPLFSSATSYSAKYLHKDHLGSVTEITNELGSLVSSYIYDPWGKKTQASWLTKGGDDFAENSFKRGFTGHEHLDNLELIHMNGRVYDPDIARFVSADPTLQFPLLSQNYDRYSYVGNNPLKFTDPTGYGWFSDLVGGAWDAFTKPFKKAWNFIEKNWRTIVVITVSAVVTVATGGVGGIILAGAISGGLSAALYGGDISDVLAGAAKGALFAAVSAGFGGALGADVAATYGQTAGYVAGVSGAGLSSGLQAEMTGGNFWAGFASGAVMKAASGPIKANTSGIGRNLSIAALGGTTSVIGGKKFGNGAVFAAYQSILFSNLESGESGAKGLAKSLYETGKEVLDTFTKLTSGLVNTAIGLAWGGVGMIFGGSAPTFDHNAIVFKEHPFMGGAIALGNTISASKGFSNWNHEKVHTYQSQALGIFYLPANVIGMSMSAVTLGAGRPTHGWDIVHGRANFMEGSPFSEKLYGE